MKQPNLSEMQPEVQNRDQSELDSLFRDDEAYSTESVSESLESEEMVDSGELADEVKPHRRFSLRRQTNSSTGADEAPKSAELEEEQAIEDALEATVLEEKLLNEAARSKAIQRAKRRSQLRKQLGFFKRILRRKPEDEVDEPTEFKFRGRLQDASADQSSPRRRSFGKSGILLSERERLIHAERMDSDSIGISEAVKLLEAQHAARRQAERQAKRRARQEELKSLRIHRPQEFRMRELRRQREAQINRHLSESAQQTRRRNVLGSPQAANEAGERFHDPLKRQRRILVLLFLLVIGATLSLLVLMPQFYLEELIIEGNQLVTTEDIRRSIHVNPGQHLFSLVNGSLRDYLSLHNREIEEQLVERFPYIQSVECRVEFPSKLRIELVESSEVAYVEIPDGYAMLDRKKRVLQLKNEALPAGIPLIQGLKLSAVHVGDYVTNEESVGLDKALIAIDALLRADRDSDDGKLVFRMLSSVRVMENQNLYLSFRGLGRKGELKAMIAANADYVKEIYWLRNAIRNHIFDDLADGYLNLGGSYRSFISVRDRDFPDQGATENQGLLPALPQENEATETAQTESPDVTVPVLDEGMPVETIGRVEEIPSANPVDDIFRRRD
ncbi:MAG: FtsQ-type POTRA domain-containing protein [Eubacteriales bacterium]|nr:FtsQ-type POTRA domain-containing protein [Eubacteriales bacterium]